MKTDTAGLSRPGGRKANQDAYGMEANDTGGCWLVADGLGGHAGGEIASRLAVDAILEHFRTSPAVSPGFIEDCFEKAQAAIQKTAEQDVTLSGMRTTLVVLVCDSKQAIWGHVGDSRLYWFREGRILHQTLDHSVPQMLVSAGKLRPQDIRGHEDQNRLTRALGNDGAVRPTILAEPFPFRAGDAALLCSDGLWTYVLEQEMESDLAEALSAADWLARMEQRVLKKASGPYDNYTAIAVLFQGATTI